MSVELDTPFVLRFERVVLPGTEVTLLGPSLLDVSALTVTHFQPAQVAGAVAWRPWPGALVTAQLTWRRWSSYVAPIPSTVTVLEGGLGDLVVPLPEFAVPEAGFHDTVEPALGVEWWFAEGTALAAAVRAGWFYRPSPAPNASGETNLVDADAHGVGLGVGLELRSLAAWLGAPPRLDVHGQAVLLEPRVTRKASVADPVGDFRSSGHLIGGGATLSVGF